MEFGIVRLIGIFVVGKFMLSHFIYEIEGFGARMMKLQFYKFVANK
jgi:hypothetical protein